MTDQKQKIDPGKNTTRADTSYSLPGAKDEQKEVKISMFDTSVLAKKGKPDYSRAQKITKRLTK